MHKVIWDQETGGVVLTQDIPEHASAVNPPRPVFYEELDLLQFNRYWDYPKCEAPLLWAIDRRYFYKGTFVAEARGGNIFDAPEIVLTDEGQDLSLEPVNIPRMLLKNQNALDTLTNEAIDFVEDTYKRYNKKKQIHFVVSFSGGKDSQVVLDIVSRVIPPDEYIVIFTDTTMEIPPTYQAVKDAEKLYTERYPGLKFYTAQNPQPAPELWKKFGPPSMILRWCCSVYKTAPVISCMRELYSEEKRFKISLYEGVRSDESPRRESYKRIATSVKYLSQVNLRVIKDWNTTEVFLYLFERDIEINEGYRYGLHRIGCSICPFGSSWYEFIIGKEFPDIANKYIAIIKEYIRELGIADEKKIKEYIIQRQWKKRAGGKGVNTENVRIDFIRETPNLKAILSGYRENFIEWIKTIGPIISISGKDQIIGEVSVGNEVFDFNVKSQKDIEKLEVAIKGIGRDILALSKVKKILYKTTYCIHCGACEAECPSGALSVFPTVQVDNTLCTHCGNCLSFVEKGCLMAKSVSMPSEGGKRMGKVLVGFDRYLRFGMRQEWVNSFFANIDRWFSNNTLGPKQVDSMIRWLRDADILEKRQKIPTPLGKVLKEIFLKDEMLVWQIIWINLFYNSSIIRWYILSTNWGTKYSQEELIALVHENYDNIGEKTAKNGLSSLFNLFDTTPYGDKFQIGIIEREKNMRYIKRVGTDDISPLAVAYSLYRYAHEKERFALTVSEFYKDDQQEGPYSLFGISREKFEQILRGLQENKNELVKVDLAADLDNIHLREDLSYEQTLELDRLK